jgi:subtilase family serine protease
MKRLLLAAALLCTAAAPISFDLLLPLRNRAQLEPFVAALSDPASPTYHHFITPAGFGLRFGPDSSTVDRVTAALRARGLTVTPLTRLLHVTGTQAQIERTFATTLLPEPTAEGGTRHVALAPLTLPPEIADTGALTFTFSPHLSHPHSRVIAAIDPANRQSATGLYWWDDLKQAYAYPSLQTRITINRTPRPLDGTGTTLAVLMSSDVLDADIADIFTHENWTALTGKPPPKLAARIAVNGGATIDSPTFAEASLDVQQELTGAPGASVVLYEIPDLSDGSIIAGYAAIVEQNAVDLVSSSFGACELEYTGVYAEGRNDVGVLAAEHELFLQGNAQGITFIASSGDEGGRACPSSGYAYNGTPGTFITSVSVPAADPNVTAVGGTNLVTTHTPGSLASVYASENAWSDPEIPYDIYGLGENVSGGVWGAGGGYSAVFGRPLYQRLVPTGSATRRALPDIGMQVGGCPAGLARLQNGICNGMNTAIDGRGNAQRSAVVVALHGAFYGLIGTSVAAPEFAGATALLIEQQGRMGNLNPYLYTLAARQAAGRGRYFHTAIPGYNGVVNTLLNPTYSLSTGLGTPLVSAYTGLPATTPLTAVPQTPSNP